MYHGGGDSFSARDPRSNLSTRYDTVDNDYDLGVTFGHNKG